VRVRALQEEQAGPEDAAPHFTQVMERPSRWLSSSELLKHLASSALGISIRQV